MNIASAAAGAATLDYARELRARAALRQARESRRAEVSEDAAKARSSPRFEASATRKQQAKAKLQQVREWLQIVKKLFAHNPKGMAKALAQVFKDLKAAVEAYKDAGGQEMGAAGEVVGAVLSAGTDPSGDAGEHGDGAAGDAPQASAPETAPTDGDEADATLSSKPEHEQDIGPGDAALAVAEGRSLYDAVVSEVRKQVGEDGLDFLKDVRGLVDDVQKLMQTARGQAAIGRRDKDAETAFEDADKALKALNETMDQMDREIRRDAPAAGMRISVAA